MFKELIVFAVFFFFGLCYGQEVEVFYKSYSVKEFTEEDLKNMDPRQRQMAQSMKENINDMEYILKIDSLTSEFTTVFKLPSPGRSNIMAQIEDDQIFYNSPKKFIEKLDAFGTVVLIEGAPYQIEWEITKETKMILGYECFLAKAEIADGGDNNLAVEAWFAPSLPYSFGPKAFYGLPGLILETIQNKAIKLQADRVILNTSVYIVEPSGGKAISRDSHKKQREAMHEMMMSRIKN